MTTRKCPTSATPSGKRRTRRPSAFSKMDFYRALDCLPSRWRPYFVTLVLTGLKDTELCQLRPESLDRETCAIQVNHASGVRTIYVAEEFWPYVVASVPVQYTHRYLRDHWGGALDRAGLKEVSVTALAQLRRRLLAEAVVGSRIIRLLTEDPEDQSVGTVQARKEQEAAKQLTQLLPGLALTEDEGRRLVVRRVRD